MTDCSQHKKDVAGISDMKVLAEMIGDLHYETLAVFTNHLANKLSQDGVRDYENKRKELGAKLMYAAGYCRQLCNSIQEVWRISKPFMNKNENK